jgi:hypothetical protein
MASGSTAMLRRRAAQTTHFSNLCVHASVRAENLNPDVLVMQPANPGVRHDASDLLNRGRDRSILVQ